MNAGNTISLKSFLLLLFLNLASLPQITCAETGFAGLHSLERLEEASLLMVDTSGHKLVSLRPEKPMIPASTLKLVTALLALETWGQKHDFVTDFGLDHDNILWIKGYGDPFLISEEIDQIVMGLQKKGLKVINGIGIDESYFDSRIHVDGQTDTNNPYDAPLAPLAANFNTINIRRENGQTFSAEKQTPLTLLMKELSKNLPSGQHRIRLVDQNQSARLFAEILMAKLKRQGVEIVQAQILKGSFPDTRFPYYRHRNSHALPEIIRAMLQYSNNFIANQLFLLLGVEKQGAPANMEKSRSVATEQINRLFNWQDFSIVEGSGISRKNRLSAQQLIDVLQRFSAWRDLLRKQTDGILAKSGTLKGISTYAGYINRQGKWLPFALMINEPVDYGFRKRVAEELSHWNELGQK